MALPTQASAADRLGRPLARQRAGRRGRDPGRRRLLRRPAGAHAAARAARRRRAVVPAGAGEALPLDRVRLRRSAAGSRHHPGADRRDGRRDRRRRAPRRRRSAPRSGCAQAGGRHGRRARPHRAAQVAHPPAGRELAARDPLVIVFQPRQPRSLPRPDPEPGRARAEGALPRLGARLPLVVHQPAAAARDLLVRLHDDHAEPRPRALQPYALFMFCGILPWTWFSSSLIGSVRLADRRRQPDQEGAVPGRDPAARQRAGEHGALLPRACRSWSAFLICYRHWPDPSGLLWFPVVVLVQLVFTAGLALVLVGADGALPRHPRHPGERADVLVLRHADHLPLVQTRTCRRTSGCST